MFLFYSKDIHQDHIILHQEEHNHCKKVLRKSVGDTLHITDGRGHIFNCRIKSFLKETTECTIIETLVQPLLQPKTAIAIAPVKNMARIEWFLEKATEIGITDIYIMMTQRAEKKGIKMERLEKIVVSAMKQSLKTHLPHMHYMDSFKSCLEYCKDKYENKFIGFCEENQKQLSEVLSPQKDTLILIGPEGDFTSEEVELSKTYGFLPISLGETRLRTETAGLVALMMMRLKAKNL